MMSFSALYLSVGYRTVNPVAHRRQVVPAFADRELRVDGTVVETRKLRSVAFDVVIAEADIPEVVDEVAQVGDDVLLDVVAQMVEVTGTAPCAAGILVLANGISVTGSLVVGTDIIGSELIGDAVDGLCRKVGP